MKTNSRRRIFLYAASVVAPQAANLKEFLATVRAGKSTLTPRESLANLFLAGTPKFDFSVYKDWLEKRHGPKRYSLLNDKNSLFVKYAIGSFIDALESRPELEKVLKTLDTRLIIQYSTGLADLPTIHQAARDFDAALLKWNDFWKDRSALLQEYLLELKQIESASLIGTDIENGKLAFIRGKAKARKELEEKYGFPTPPWESVSGNLLWNIPNVPASQVSMLLDLHGVASGYAGACASFGSLIDNAMLEINSGRVDLAIIGGSDPIPSDELISAFYSGRLGVLGDEPSRPFCSLRGTHVSGGACTWIVAAEDVMNKFGIKPLPVEILGAGVSSDAEHIITPSKEGPKLAVRRALVSSQIDASQINLWDMHATGTPGDWNEFTLIQDIVPQSAYISARKGIFGHGMSVGGGWELTAQVLGMEYTKQGTCLLPPSGIPAASVHPKITAIKRKLLLDKKEEIPLPPEGLICGKLSMGLGGLSSCVISRVTKDY